MGTSAHAYWRPFTLQLTLVFTEHTMSHYSSAHSAFVEPLVLSQYYTVQYYNLHDVLTMSSILINLRCV